MNEIRDNPSPGATQQSIHLYIPELKTRCDGLAAELASDMLLLYGIDFTWFCSTKPYPQSNGTPPSLAPIKGCSRDEASAQLPLVTT